MLALLIALPTLTSCGGEKKPLRSSKELDSIAIRFVDRPADSRGLEHDYEIRLLNAGNAAADVDSVKLTLSMTMRNGMTHGKSGVMKRIAAGVYQVRLKLPMEGSYLGSVTLRKGDFGRTVANLTS